MQLTQNQPRGPKPDGKQQSVINRIRSHWGNLTDEEVGYASNDRQRFYETVTRKYGVPQEQVKLQLAAWERESREAA